MVIVFPQNYTIHTPTPILNANNGEHYARLTAFDPDMLITFDIRPEDDIEGNTDIWVNVQMPPVIPLCKFLNHIYVFDIVYSKIVDN